MQTRTPRAPKTFRVSDAEFAAIGKAATDAGLAWTTFVRQAALTAARQQLRPASVQLDSGEVLALIDTLEDE